MSLADLLDAEPESVAGGFVAEETLTSIGDDGEKEGSARNEGAGVGRHFSKRTKEPRRSSTRNVEENKMVGIVPPPTLHWGTIS